MNRRALFKAILLLMITLLVVTLKPPRMARCEVSEDIRLLAEVMYYENYSNGTKAMIYTGSVVINRAKYCSWCPDTIKGVLYQKGQYSTTGKFYKKKLPVDVVALATALYIGGSQIPHKVIYQSMFMQGSGLYEQVGTDYFCYE